MMNKQLQQQSLKALMIWYAAVPPLGLILGALVVLNPDWGYWERALKWMIQLALLPWLFLVAVLLSLFIVPVAIMLNGVMVVATVVGFLLRPFGRR